jgi:hypothetical protein
MASNEKSMKQSAAERRKGESVSCILPCTTHFQASRLIICPESSNANLTHHQALSDFADFVEKQQALRKPPGTSASKPTTAIEEEHDELSILDTLNLSDSAPRVQLRSLLLSAPDDEASSVALADYIKGRLLEGHGEALFDLGLEDNGDSMGFDKAQWATALERLKGACEACGADHKMLMTRNVGPEGDEDGVEVGAGTLKEKGSCGKLMLRKRMGSVDDVIETRIAVVGNGE